MKIKTNTLLSKSVNENIITSSSLLKTQRIHRPEVKSLNKTINQLFVLKLSVRVNAPKVQEIYISNSNEIARNQLEY